MEEREQRLLHGLLQQLGDVFERTGLPGPCHLPLPDPFQEAMPSQKEQSFSPPEQVQRLSPVAERVRLSASGNSPLDYQFRYPLKPLSIQYEDLIPKKDEEIGGYVREDYRQIWQEFIEEMTQVQGQEQFDAYFFTLYFLIKKYFSRIPSTEADDVSIFDHARVHTAVSDCQYQYQQAKGDKKNSPQTSGGERVQSSETGKDLEDSKESLETGTSPPEEEPEVLLIEGNLSGIQNFLSNMAVSQHERTRLAKRLRGRSFYLLLLVETIAEYLLKHLGLTIVHQLWCTGGDFLFVAPNVPAVTYHLKACYHDINEFLLQGFRGDLSLILASMPVSKSMIYERMENVRLELRKALDREKTRKLCSVLQTQAMVQFPSLSPEQEEQHHQEQEWLGQRLTRLNQGDGRLVKKVKSPADPWHKEPLVVFEIGKSYHIGWDINPDDYAQVDTVYLVNNIGEKFWGGGKTKYGFKFLATHVDEYDQVEAQKVNKTLAQQGDRPLKDWVSPGDVKGFVEMAQAGSGNCLGVLKMDVDRLDLLLNSGFASCQGNLARITAFSADVELFFIGYINQLCRAKFRKNTYIAYAGGDDLFMVGAWDDLLNLACQIRKDFAAFTCHNPDISLSGSLFLCHGTYPINRATQQATSLLEDVAKENILQEPDLAGKINCRNALAIFNHRLRWKDVFSLQQVGDQCIEAIAHRNLPRTSLYKLLDLHRTWKTNRKLNVARLYYTAVRTIQHALCRDLILGQHRYLANTSYIPILVSYATLKTRTQKQGGNDEQSGK